MEDVEIVPPEELKKRFPLFERLPYKFLSWNANAVVRRRLGRSEVLFREGEYGSTAFLLTQGSLRQEVRAAMWHARADRSTSWLSNALGHRALSRISRIEERNRQGDGRITTIRTEAGRPLSLDAPFSLLVPDDPWQIIGEGACLNNYPRAATVTASEPSEVLEFRRNVLLAMLRNPLTRQQINEAYRLDALAPYLMGVPLFAGLGVDHRSRCAEYLARNTVPLDFVRVHPEQVIFRQGEDADDLYLVRIGFVKVAQSVDGREVVLDYIGPGGVFGELGLVAGAAPVELAPVLHGHVPGKRLTTCTALDTVELVRIRGEVFRDLVVREPELLRSLAEGCRQQIERYWGEQASRPVSLGSYLQHGLQSARQLLVIDLERCTRCDECTKACADSHGGVTRLIREGIRHDKYLVATSCRSCLNPYCMAGCPVDAIHRGKEREIVIEDWCIGCGSCETNCPYDNIRMVEGEVYLDAPDRPGRKVAVRERKATTCDLCQDFLGPGEVPSCIFACPHDAASRLNSEEFLKRIAAAVQGD